MKHSEGHTLTHEDVVAKSSACVVRSCKCGMVHVLFGSVTVHLTAAGFAAVNATITQAAARLAERGERWPPLLC